MKGNNKLEFNEATMIEAMQEYLDKRMTVFAPKVEGVSFEGNGHYRTFMVRTTDRDPYTDKPDTEQ